MAKDCTKGFHNWRANGLHFNFPNGNWLSSIWGGGSYTENHDKLREETDHVIKTGQQTYLESDTVEIMFDCGDRLKKRILKKYNEGENDPIGYVTFAQWLEIVSLLNKEKK